MKCEQCENLSDEVVLLEQRTLCFKCWYENPKSLSDPICRELCCQPHIIKRCQCGGVLGYTEHRTFLSFRFAGDLSHIGERTEYYKHCYGQHEFTAASPTPQKENS